ncbi:MAG: FMN-binding protein [Rhodospirillaceae bacterium]|nr:FMN-binding protein [Rhodospirillaceae bacterium]
MRAKFLLVPATVLALGTSALAVDLQTLEMGQQKLFPGAALTKADFTLTQDQFEILKAEFNVPAFRPAFKAWRAEDGSWLILDQVYGLNDVITYLVALTPDGVSKGIEVLVCAENFCDLYTPEWRAQLAGKKPGKWDPTDEVQMVSGSTLSSVHVTEGVKKILAIHSRYLKGK